MAGVDLFLPWVSLAGKGPAKLNSQPFPGSYRRGVLWAVTIKPLSQPRYKQPSPGDLDSVVKWLWFETLHIKSSGFVNLKVYLKPVILKVCLCGFLLFAERLVYIFLQRFQEPSGSVRQALVQLLALALPSE